MTAKGVPCPANKGRAPANKGKSKFVWAYDQIERMASYGASLSMCAKVVGCAESTFRAKKEAKAAWERGHQGGKLALLEKMHGLAADSKNATMLIWLSKNRLGYTDKPPEQGVADQQVKLNIKLSTEPVKIKVSNETSGNNTDSEAE